MTGSDINRGEHTHLPVGIFRRQFSLGRGTVIATKHRIHRIQVVIHADIVTGYIQGVRIRTVANRIPVDTTGGRGADEAPLADFGNLKILIGDAFVIFDINPNNDVLIAGFLSP